MKMKRKNLIILIVIFSLYLISYFIISRSAEVQVKEKWEIENTFLYTIGEIDKFEKDPDGIAFKVHWALYCFYFPVWIIDHNILNGPTAMKSLPMFKLGE